MKSYSPSKLVHFACFFLFLTIFSLLWRALTFGSKQDMKSLETYLKSARFKVSEKYNLKYFEQEQKIFIFFIFIIELFENLYSLNSSSQNYLFNEISLLIISFYLQEQLTKMCGLPIFLTYSLSSKYG